MVKLKNIKLSGTMVSADCYKEGKEEGHFFIIIRLLDSGRPLPSEASSTWC